MARECCSIVFFHPRRGRGARTRWREVYDGGAWKPSIIIAWRKRQIASRRRPRYFRFRPRGEFSQGPPGDRRPRVRGFRSRVMVLAFAFARGSSISGWRSLLSNALHRDGLRSSVNWCLRRRETDPLEWGLSHISTGYLAGRHNRGRTSKESRRHGIRKGHARSSLITPEKSAENDTLG